MPLMAAAEAAGKRGEVLSEKPWMEFPSDNPILSREAGFARLTALMVCVWGPSSHCPDGRGEGFARLTALIAGEGPPPVIALMAGGGGPSSHIPDGRGDPLISLP